MTQRPTTPDGSCRPGRALDRSENQSLVFSGSFASRFFRYVEQLLRLRRVRPVDQSHQFIHVSEPTRRLTSLWTLATRSIEHGQSEAC